VSPPGEALSRLVATKWRRFALGAATSTVVWLVCPSRPRVVVIDVDRGIADCPWPVRPGDPNGPSRHRLHPRDLPFDAVRDDVLLVLRNREHVVFAERVAEVRCQRPPEGPRILARLSETPRASSRAGDEPPKAHASAAPRANAYRAVLGLFRQFDTQLCATAPQRALDAWFVREDDQTVLPLGRIGQASRAAVRIEGGASSTLSLDVTFAHTPTAPIHTCLPVGSERRGSVLPPCPEGDPAAWRPTSPRRCPEVGAAGESLDPQNP
jgi:hypothetical protein